MLKAVEKILSMKEELSDAGRSQFDQPKQEINDIVWFYLVNSCSIMAHSLKTHKGAQKRFKITKTKKGYV
jgi:hypothetical protein